MNSIISVLVVYNQFLIAQIHQLLLFIVKNIHLKSPKYDLTSPKYNKLAVDRLPLLVRPEVSIERTYDFKVLLNNFRTHSGKELKPVRSRKGKITPSDVICPHCGAPSIYIYDNTGGRGQFLCKVCDNTFFKGTPKPKPGAFYCPFCGSILVKKKDRKHFNIHKCVNKKCSFYLNSLKKLSPEDLAEYQKDKHKFKLHYIYREFTIDFFKVDLSTMPKGSVNFTFRNFSPHILGLCLTYLVNLGMSTRATSRAMREIHGVVISHVTISKYAKTAASLVQPFVDSFDYKPTNYIAADETYIKVKGIRHYVWFIMDALKKSILGYQISSTRDVGPCILAMRMAFAKFKEFPGKALKFISDGYSAYNLAQQQFSLNNMDFDLTQVIGLTNDDPVSTEYRWLKQIIERLNRTFKFSYQITNGYGSNEGSSAHVSLFVAYYNFLRPHPYTYWQPLNALPGFDSLPNMPAKWQKLIELSQVFILSKQAV